MARHNPNVSATARTTIDGIEVTLLVPNRADSVVHPGTTDGSPVIAELPFAVEPPRGRRAHSRDFAGVVWDGVQYTFTEKQRAIVSLLWQAYEDGTHYLATAILLEEAESEGKKMSSLFEKNPAWNRMIVKGSLSGGPHGTYRLAP